MAVGARVAQAGEAAVSLLGFGGLEDDAELLAPEPKRNAELVATLFEPGRAAPPIVFERNSGAGAIDLTPTQGQCCPQTWLRERKKASRENPKSLENMQFFAAFRRV